jgi:ribosome biogenesis GTPase
MWGIDPDDLAYLFPEFRSLIDDCRFGSSCTHTHEPRCAIRTATETGAVDAGRYESYRKLYEECGGSD